MLKYLLLLLLAITPAFAAEAKVDAPVIKKTIAIGSDSSSYSEYLEQRLSQATLEASGEYQDLHAPKWKSQVRILFPIDREGHVKNINLLKSSGSQELDKLARALILRSSPFERPPEELFAGGTAVNFIYTFHFRGSQLTRPLQK